MVMQMKVEHEKTTIEFDEWATEYFTLKLKKGAVDAYNDRLDLKKNLTVIDKKMAKLWFIQKRMKVVGNDPVFGEDWEVSSKKLYKAVFGEKY
jgi:hypothetical protein